MKFIFIGQQSRIYTLLGGLETRGEAGVLTRDYFEGGPYFTNKKLAEKAAVMVFRQFLAQHREWIREKLRDGSKALRCRNKQETMYFWVQVSEPKKMMGSLREVAFYQL